MTAGSEDYWDTKAGGVLAALDALDGTIDGRLDLTDLNSSSVKTNLDTVITRLNSTISALNDVIAALLDQWNDSASTGILKDTKDEITASKFVSWCIAATGSATVAECAAGETFSCISAYAHPENDGNVYVVLKNDSVEVDSETLTAGESWTYKGTFDEVVVQGSGTNHYYWLDITP